MAVDMLGLEKLCWAHAVRVIHSMKITIVAFEGCMTSAVYGQADAFAIAAYIAGRRADTSWSDHDVRRWRRRPASSPG